MRVPSSLKFVVATWIAALLGALAGRALAEASVGGAQVSQSGANPQGAQLATEREH
jgi:hypothetical protein